MRNLNEFNITDAVLKSFDRTVDPRLKEILFALVRHLHDLAREVKLTEREWMQAIEFLTKTGHTCTDVRQEFILLSDTLGLSQLVVAQNNSRPDSVTEQTVFGPFHVPGAPVVPQGGDITFGRKGSPCFVQGRVLAQGDAVANAQVDVWQADGDGFYDVQVDGFTKSDMGLRAVQRTDADGRFAFRSVLPASYPIPTDGSVGDMLRATSRHPMRPAHIHLMVAKDGYETLITHVFVDGDEYLESDTVFGVRSSCIGQYIRHDPGVAPTGERIDELFYTLNYDVVLQPRAAVAA